MPQVEPPDDRTLRRRRELGDRVRSLRLWRNLAQDRTAHAAGMSRSTLQRVEYGQTALSVDRLWAIADILRVPVTWLLTDDWSHSGEAGAGDEDPPPPRATPRHR